MRLIVSRSTKKTDLGPSPTGPAGAAASGDRSAAGRTLSEPRTSSIISNRPGVLVLSTVLVVALSSTLILSSADGSRRLPVLSLQGSEANSKFKDVKGSGFEAHLLDVLAKTKGKIVELFPRDALDSLTNAGSGLRLGIPNRAEDADYLGRSVGYYPIGSCVWRCSRPRCYP